MADEPIILVEDDPDDQHLVGMVCKSLNIKRTLKIFGNGVEALAYLRTTTDRPFVILCDVNMPLMNGLELQAEIDKDEALKKKSIPFVFLSTTAAASDVEQAYQHTVQGFFEKGLEMEVLKKRLRIIFDYWEECKHPNAFARR